MSDGSHVSAEMRHRAIQAVQDGLPVGQVASAYGVNRTALFRWSQRVELEGQQGLQRKAGSGRPRKLEALTEEELYTLVIQPASDFGSETDLWTALRLRHVIDDQFGLLLSKSSVLRRLRRPGLTYQKPEREYFEIDERTRAKWLRYEVPKIRRAIK